MAGYKGSQGKLVDSDYLYRTLKAEDNRRTKKLHDSLFVDYKTVPMHYIASVMGEEGALIIVANGSLVDSSSEVEESTVNANKLPDDLTTYNVGEYVKKDIYLKASTLNKEDTDLDLSTFDDITP